MAYSGENIAEHMVPMAAEVKRRILGFYHAIGWSVLSGERGRLISVVPDTDERPVDGIGYWRTDSPHRVEWFRTYAQDPRGYNRGLRLPRLMDLIERPLVLPTEGDIKAVMHQGGRLLSEHTHIRLRDHAGRVEFRFADPFLYGIRVTGPKLATKPVNVGDIIRAPLYGNQPRVITQIDPTFNAWPIAETESGKQVLMGGTVIGAVEVLGSMSIEELADGMAQAVPISQEEHLAFLKEQSAKGPIQRPVVSEPTPN